MSSHAHDKYLDNQHIVQVKKTHFQGVILDENLNWKSEISHIAKLVMKLRSQSVQYLNAASFFVKLLYVCSTIS